MSVHSTLLPLQNAVDLRVEPVEPVHHAVHLGAALTLCDILFACAVEQYLQARHFTDPALNPEPDPSNNYGQQSIPHNIHFHSGARLLFSPHFTTPKTILKHFDRGLVLCGLCC